MRCEREEADMDNLFVKHEIIEYEIEHPVETDVSTSRRTVSEQLSRN